MTRNKTTVTHGVQISLANYDNLLTLRALKLQCEKLHNRRPTILDDDKRANNLAHYHLHKEELKEKGAVRRTKIRKRANADNRG